jgi:hypothetical protein
MAASTYKCKLREELNHLLRRVFPVNTSSEAIEPGDLVELNVSTGKISLLQDDTVTAGSVFVGIADGRWSSADNDYLDAAAKGLPVVGYALVQATVASAAYSYGDPLEYSASDDDGTLKAHTAGNQYIGWVFDTVTGTRTEALVLLNIFDSRVNTFTTSS